jgi:hypothetical protein
VPVGEVAARRGGASEIEESIDVNAVERLRVRPSASERYTCASNRGFAVAVSRA